MERGKMGSAGRGGKSKAPQHPQDIFALGTKSTVVVPRDSEKRNIHKPTTSGVDRKRDAPSFGVPPPGKKSRIGSPAESVGGTSLDVDPVDLVPHVLQALDTHNSDKLLGLLTGSIRLLKSQRAKPDPILCMSMLYLTKIRPNMFAHETVTQSLCSLLKREQGAAFKNKGNPLVFVLACNMLYAGHRDSKTWPDAFIKVYIEDALNERCWVDCSWCKCLVENIVTAFNTKKPPPHLIPTDTTLGTMSPSGSGSPLTGTAEDDVDNSELEYSVFSRYSGNYEAVEGMVLEAIKEQLQRRVAPDAIGKGFLKLLAATCGFPEIRIISASRLEAWLHSGKLWRAAQELLAYASVNADPARDHELLAQLARMRLKTKPLVNAYIACLREMVSESGALLRAVVTHTIYNELSNVRSPNNMAVLGALALAQPIAVPAAMADTYIELLVRAEDYLRPLRALSRELAGRARDCAALPPLAAQLAQPPPQPPPSEIRERMFNSLVDLFTTLCLIVACHGKHCADYKQTIASIQCAALGWLLDTAPPIYRHNVNYRHALHKIMFLESADVYSKVDNWPAESERALAHRQCSEAPLLHIAIMRIAYIGLHKDIPISPSEALEVLETCVRRACALPPEDNPLQAEPEVTECLFRLALFQPPDNVPLPAGYTVPPLAITSLYWRVWVVVVMLCAHNPAELARAAYTAYPALPPLIETAITNKPSQEWTEPTQAEVEAERAAILQLESHLAAASNSKLPVTEHNCRLPSQLMTFSPTGPARKPPAAVWEVVSALSGSLRLGRLLCRQPALLLQLTQRHGTRRAMPWLQRLLRHERTQLSALPVQCLCEFLSFGGGESEPLPRLSALAAHLRGAVRRSAPSCAAVLHYYTQRLPAPHPRDRANAHRGLKIVLSPTNDDLTDADFTADVGPESWLDLVVSLPHWGALEAEVVSRVRAACLVECAPAHLAAYIAFLPTCHHEDDTQLLLELSHVIMERSTVSNYILPSGERSTDLQHRTLHALTTMFYNYMQKIRSSTEPIEPVNSEWAGVTEVTWPDGRTVRLPSLLPHAQLKLLCCGPSRYDTGQVMYKYLESQWVGASGPVAGEGLLPDWLRLHLVRSASPPLVEAGLAGLSAAKLALFIQTFGMPVSSMSALLAALDRAPAGAVSRLHVERGYMSALLGVQRARGATHGHAFAAMLALAPDQAPAEDPPLFQEAPLPAETGWLAGRAGARQALSPALVLPLLANAFSGGRPPIHAYQYGEVDSAVAELVQKVTEECRQPSRPFTESVVSFFSSTANHRVLCASLRARAALAAPLLRALHAQRPPPPSLLRVCQSLLSKMGGEGGAGAGAGPVEAALREVCAQRRPPAQAVTHTTQDLIIALESSTPATLEEVGSRIIESQDAALVVDVISHILEKNQQGAYEVKSESGYSGHVFSRSGGGCGLLLDWVSALQQHTTGDNHQRQMRVMFGRGSEAGWRALAVSLLAHRAPCAALHACLANLLAHRTEWSPTAVLNFVWSVSGAAGLADRRRHSPRGLTLTHPQISSLVSYIILEASETEELEAMRVRILRRLPLLLQVCGDDARLLSAALAAAPTPAPAHGDVTAPAPAHTGDVTDAQRMFLLLLYLQVPRIQQLLAESLPRGRRARARLPDLASLDKQSRVEQGLRGAVRGGGAGAGGEAAALRSLLPLADSLLAAAPLDSTLLDTVYRCAVNGGDGARSWRDEDDHKPEEGERRRRGRQRPKHDETETAWKCILELSGESGGGCGAGGVECGGRAGAARAAVRALGAAAASPAADCALPRALHVLVNNYNTN